jgi:hypothetical protein
MAPTSLIACSLIVLLSIKSALSYYILVDAHSEECFFEKLTSGTKLLLTFEVIEGGFLDIDVKVKRHSFIFIYKNFISIR